MASLRKAQAIFAGASPLRVLSGPKVREFYRAIMGDSDAAVVDVWIGRAAGLRGPVTARQYDQVAQALRIGAAHARVPTSTFQATAWLVARG